MSKSNLLKAYQAASKEGHKRKFMIAGEEIFIPRLNLGNQAQFEQIVRQRDPKFSLANTRNKAALAMVRCHEATLREIRERGAPAEFKNQAEAEMWKQQILILLLTAWEPYAEQLFGQFTRQHMIEALTLALQQEYGKNIGEGEEKIPVDQALAEALFGAAGPNILETAFLWCTGLQDIPEESSPEQTARTLDELINQLVGNPKGLEKLPEENGTTPNISRSSAPSMG